MNMVTPMGVEGRRRVAVVTFTWHRRGVFQG
jgi:hypothetical protein